MPNVNVQPTIDAINAATSLDDGLLTFFQTGLPALIQKAKDDAIANGATEAELAPFADLSATLAAKSAAVTAALAANTPISPAQMKAKK